MPSAAAKFHPENDPKPRKLPKGPNGPGLNDKDEWSKLAKEWKEKIDGGKDEELRAEASQVGLNEVANQTLKSADEDLKRCREALNVAGAQYAEATKANKLKLQYIRHLLEARGKEPAASELGLVSKT